MAAIFHTVCIVFLLASAANAALVVYVMYCALAFTLLVFFLDYCAVCPRQTSGLVVHSCYFVIGKQIVRVRLIELNLQQSQVQTKKKDGNKLHK